MKTLIREARHGQSEEAEEDRLGSRKIDLKRRSTTTTNQDINGKSLSEEIEAGVRTSQLKKNGRFIGGVLHRHDGHRWAGRPS